MLTLNLTRHENDTNMPPYISIALNLFKTCFISFDILIALIYYLCVDKQRELGRRDKLFWNLKTLWKT